MLGVFFVLTVFAYPSIFVHELGHVLAAKLVGLRPTHLIVGESEVLFQRTVRGVKLIVCLVPFHGLAIVEREKMSRFQIVIFAAAGPAANAGLAALIVIIWPYFNHHFTLGAIFMHQLAIAFLNLVPQDWEFEGRRFPSDGKQILSCFHRNKPDEP